MTAEESSARAFWERRAPAWQRHLRTIDEHLAIYGRPAIDGLKITEGDRVLDLGCGPGTTTHELAHQVGPRGRVLGVDVSPAMVSIARHRNAGVANVRFVVADVQIDELGHGFDAAYSRFAMMLLPDPAAGLANLRGALRVGGRLAFVTWGPLRENPWMYVPRLAAAPLLGLKYTLPGPAEPNPYPFSDPDSIHELLTGAGFVDIAVKTVHGVRRINHDHADQDLTGLMEEGGALADRWDSTVAPSTRSDCIQAITEAIQPYHAEDGWHLPGMAYCATAGRH